jgi:site-specific DNA recombinase
VVLLNGLITNDKFCLSVVSSQKLGWVRGPRVGVGGRSGPASRPEGVRPPSGGEHATKGQTLTEDDIFRDDGYSGASLNRPGLDQLRDRVSRTCLERVLITSPDRLARRFVHQILIIEEFERAGCEIQFLDRPMSQDPHDQLLLQIRGAVAEYERVLIAERMRRGRQLRLRSGTLLPWTTPPYGYRLAPDRPRDPAGVRIEPIEGALVQELFVRYLEPQGTLLRLAKYLLELGVPSPHGNARWSAASLRGILTNPA